MVNHIEYIDASDVDENAYYSETADNESHEKESNDAERKQNYYAETNQRVHDFYEEEEEEEEEEDYNGS